MGSLNTDVVVRRGFDINRYLMTAGGIRPENFNWSDPGPPLEDDALFCLGYMMDIESHTIIYLREMLNTALAEDVSITAFLSCWAYEEFFHSLVLRRFLEVHGVAVDDRRFAQLRRRRPADYLAQRLGRALSRLSRHFPAIHMTWGAINELSTLTGYQALTERAGNPLLCTVLSRIIKDERRHFSFYFNQAQTRLKPRAAQLMTAAVVRNFWTPVGGAVRGDADVRRVCTYLFADEDRSKRLALIDARIARLPGFGWFDLAARFCRGT